MGWLCPRLTHRGAVLFQLKCRCLCFVNNFFSIDAPINVRKIQDFICDEVAHNTRNSRSVLVRENNDPNAVRWEKTSTRREAINISTVLYTVMPTIGDKGPAKTII